MREKVAAGWWLVRVSRMGKCCGSLLCCRGDGDEGRQGKAGGREWEKLGEVSGRSSGTGLSFSIMHILHASSCLWVAQPSWVSPKCSSTGRKEVEAAGAEINAVLLSTGQLALPHQVLPSAPLPTKPMQRCSWPLRARAAEVEVQEVGSRHREHPCSWELPGRQVGSSPWFSSSLDTRVGQPASSTG